MLIQQESPASAPAAVSGAPSKTLQWYTCGECLLIDRSGTNRESPLTESLQIRAYY
jgi:hypothetical protein